MRYLTLLGLAVLLLAPAAAADDGTQSQSQTSQPPETEERGMCRLMDYYGHVDPDGCYSRLLDRFIPPDGRPPGP